MGRRKVNVDGKYKGILSLCACNAIFRNDKSNHIGSFTHFISEGNALIAEFTRGVMAMEVVIDRSWDKIWIETDSLMVVKFLSNPNVALITIKNRLINCLHRMYDLRYFLSRIFIGKATCVQTILRALASRIKPLLGLII